MKLAFISVAEAAARKGVSRSAIYKAIATGRLQAHSILGKVALRERDVEKWQTSAVAGRLKGSRLSPEVKARISQSQRERWEKRKSEQQRRNR